MPINLDLIKTIVVVMMENRSFDHLLGYLCLEPFNRNDVEGLKSTPAWQDKAASDYNGANIAHFCLPTPMTS